jgi:hypothetical protein
MDFWNDCRSSSLFLEGKDSRNNYTSFFLSLKGWIPGIIDYMTGFQK